MRCYYPHRRQSLGTWLITPGRRWWQLGTLAIDLALALLDRHERRRSP